MIKRKWDEANGSDGNIRDVFEKYQLDKSSKFHESKDIYGVVVRYPYMCAIPACEEFITEFCEFPFLSPNSVHASSPFSVNHIFFH